MDLKTRHLLLSVIGTGVSVSDLPPSYCELIRQADIVVGGKRHLESLKKSRLVLKQGVLKKEITKDIRGLTDFLAHEVWQNKNIAVLASGDPLFFGIGTTLLRALGKENVRVCPNITSVGAAFARIKEPWQDVGILSLHGNNAEEGIVESLRGRDKIAVFTDPVKNPAWIAQKLIDKGGLNYSLCVLERMGEADEKHGWYELKDAAGKEFSDPNIVILKRTGPGKESKRHVCIGMPDNEFHHQRGLITKSEIRAVTLAKLDLKEDSVFWDLGAGSGSVSVEASVFIKTGKIIAVEKNPERVKDIEKNKEKFGVENLDIINKTLPNGLASLPRPDRVFIGGGGRDLEEIIRTAAAFLEDKGLIVVNTVILGNIDIAVKTLKQAGFTSEIVQIQVSRGHDMPGGEMLKSLNPVWIIRGLR